MDKKDTESHKHIAKEREGEHRVVKRSLTYDGQVGHAGNTLGLRLDLADIV